MVISFFAEDVLPVDATVVDVVEPSRLEGRGHDADVLACVGIAFSSILETVIVDLTGLTATILGYYLLILCSSTLVDLYSLKIGCGYLLAHTNQT